MGARSFNSRVARVVMRQAETKSARTLLVNSLTNVNHNQLVYFTPLESVPGVGTASSSRIGRKIMLTGWQCVCTPGPDQRGWPAFGLDVHIQLFAYFNGNSSKNPDLNAMSAPTPAIDTGPEQFVDILYQSETRNRGGGALLNPATSGIKPVAFKKFVIKGNDLNVAGVGVAPCAPPMKLSWRGRKVIEWPELGAQASVTNNLCICMLATVYAGGATGSALYVGMPMFFRCWYKDI